MLIAADNSRPSDGERFQSCLMAPTEILAHQHYNSITKLLKDMPVTVKLHTGSSSTKQRKEVLQMCENGEVHILIGTHAVIENAVQFKNLGLAIVVNDAYCCR